VLGLYRCAPDQAHSNPRPIWRRSHRLLAATLTALACFASVASTALADQTVAYSVQPGDTVFSLARHFGITPDAIASLNHLPDPNVLAVGQQLQINLPGSVSTQLFGSIVPDRRDDVAAQAIAITFAPALPSQTSGGLPFGAIAPDRRDDVAPSTDTNPPSGGNPVPAPVKVIAATGVALAPAPVQVAASPPPAPAAAPAAPSAPPSPAAPAPPSVAASALKAPAIIAAPYHSQFDGTVWAETNCGPTSLSMALGAFGINVDEVTLRGLANRQMGFANPGDGTTWESLAYAAKAEGVSTSGLYNANSKAYRSWSIDDLKSELAKGHPVLMLVHYRFLPDHFNSLFGADHYIVALGFDASGNLVYNDPAFKVSPGSGRTIDPANLQNAWSHTSAGLVRTALALAR
jgi:LysM repeat protein